MSIVAIILILSVLGMLLQGIFIAVEHKGMMTAAAVLKGTAALVFVIIGFIGYGYFLKSPEAVNTDATAGLTKTVSFMICLGLFFGMLGDIILALRFVFMTKLHMVFLLGILVFFIGHIFYMIALIPMSENMLICVPVGAVIAAVIMAVIYKTMEIKPAYMIFGLFYIEAVVIMTVIAVGNRIEVSSAFRTWFAVGAVLFTISDIIMIFNTFGEKKRFFPRIMNLSLYYVGQLLIATSLFFV